MYRMPINGNGILGICFVSIGFFLFAFSAVASTALEVGCGVRAETSGEASVLGDAYFGGSKGYDLGCARLLYERSLELDPRGSMSAWHQLGRIDFLEGKFESAIDKFLQQIEYFGDALPNVHYMIGLTYGFEAQKTGKAEIWKAAEESFVRYIALDPLSPWARVDMSWVLFSQGKYEEMKPYLEEGLLTHPHHPWLLNMYGLALLNTQDIEGAQLYFAAAVHFANTLTTEEWGAAYPGNDPRSWEQGLSEMKLLFKKNLTLANTKDR